MKRSGKTILCLSLLATSLIIPVTSCNGNNVQVEDKKCEVKEIKLSTKAINLEVGERDQFDYDLIGTIDGENIVNKKITYTYDDKVISFNERKLEVKAVGVGTTDLVLTASNGVSAKITITVTQTILATSLSCNFNRNKIAVGESLQLDVTVAPENATNKELTFTSSNRTVATVSKTGEIVGVSEGSATITVSYAANSEVSPLTFDIEVSLDEQEVKNDIAVANIQKAVDNEINDINAGEISIVTKTKSTSEQTFTNSYSVYDDHIYNVINDYKNKQYTLYYGADNDYLYTINGDSKTYDRIVESSYSSSAITKEKAKKMLNLGAYIEDYWNSKYSYGVGTYLKEDIIDGIFLNSTNSKKTSISSSEDSLTLTLDVKDSTVYSTKYSLIVTKQGDNFKTIKYSKERYNADDLNEDFSVKDEATPYEYYYLDSSFTVGNKGHEDNPTIDYKSLFFTDFDVDFMSNKSGVLSEAKTTFNRGDTIVYSLKDFAPSTADGNFVDRIYVTSVSDTNVLTISDNKMALLASGAGTCTVTLKSKNVTKTYTLTVVVPKAESFKLSGLENSFKSNETMRFKVTYEPWGADDDFTITLKEESKEYATLIAKDSLGYYALKAVDNFEYESKVIYLDIACASNPELNCTKEVTIIGALTDSKIKSSITEKSYVGEGSNTYTYGGTLTFNDDNSASFVITYRNGAYETINFNYVINSGKLSTASIKYANGYFTGLKIDLSDVTYKTIKVTLEDNTDGDTGGEIYVFNLTKESN